MCKTFIMCTELFVRGGSVKHKLGEWSLPNTKYAVMRGTTTFAQHLHQRDATLPSPPSVPNKTQCLNFKPRRTGTKGRTQGFFHIHESDGYR